MGSWLTPAAFQNEVRAANVVAHVARQCMRAATSPVFCQLLTPARCHLPHFASAESLTSSSGGFSPRRAGSRAHAKPGFGFVNFRPKLYGLATLKGTFPPAAPEADASRSTDGRKGFFAQPKDPRSVLIGKRM